MPELPHVAAFKQYVDATAIGRSVLHTHVRDERVLEGVTPASLGQRLTGHRLVASRRHGKYLGIALNEDERGAPHLVLHFAMSGGLERYADEADEPDYAVFVLDLGDGGHLAFTCKRMFCKVRLVDGFDRFVEKQGLGPDALDESLDAAWFADQLEGRRGTVKHVLMDQSLIAGIGNEFADEILFRNRLHPEAPVDRIGDDRLSALWRDLRETLGTAVDNSMDLDSMPGDWLLRVRDNDDARCPKCGGELEHRPIAGRSSYFCPDCQRYPEDAGDGE